METTIGVGLLLFSALLSVLISVYFILFGRKSRLLYSFLLCQAAIFVWSLGHAVEITAVNVNVRWNATCAENLSICFIGFIWLYFSLMYTGCKFLQNSKRLFLLLIIPCIMYIAFFTNYYHKMYYTVFKIDKLEYGPFFWIHTSITYIYVFTGTILIIRHALNLIGKERKQSILMIMAVTIPFASNVLHLLNVVSFKFDVTPISFSISLFLFAVATFKYSFLNTIPAGLRKVFDTVDSAIMLVDNHGTVLSCNNSFKKTFEEAKNILEFESYIREKMDNSLEQESLLEAITNGALEPVLGEIKLDNTRIFRAAVQPVFDKKHQIIARVISFTDITSYRELANELEEKNTQLTAANEQLKQHMLMIEELAVLKERSRVARDIHDTLGHTLTFLTKIQESVIIDLGTDNEKILETMKKANEITRQGLRELRISIYDMMPDRSGDLIEDLNRLSSRFKSSGINIDVAVDGNLAGIDSDKSHAVFRVCQEAVTNSIKHGNADEIHIILRFSDNISLFIIDNGSGCGEIKKGFGLAGIEDRVVKVGGNVIFGSDGESGFNIHAEIPLRGEK